MAFNGARLRARWIVDPYDPAGRRMIAVWSREIWAPAPVRLPDPAGVRLASKNSVLRDLMARIAS